MSKRFLSFILILSIAFSPLLGACANKEKPVTAAELLSLGEKYLLDMDYEQSIVSFLKLIEIDPKNPKAYLGLAQAYQGSGNIAEAIKALKLGLSVIPDDPELLAALAALEALAEAEAAAAAAQTAPASPSGPGTMTASAPPASSGAGTSSSSGTSPTPASGGSSSSSSTPSSQGTSTAPGASSTPGTSSTPSATSTPGTASTANPGTATTVSPGGSSSGSQPVAQTKTPEIAATAKPTPTPIPNEITFSGNKFSVAQGAAVEIPYEVKGAAPSAVAVKVKDNGGSDVSGFTADTANKKIIGPKTLAAGAYAVTATAKFGAEEKSAGFTLEVTPAAPVVPLVKPPIIVFSNTSYSTKQGTALEIAYNVTGGGKPDTVSVSATVESNAPGASATGISANTATAKIVAPDTLAVGVYTINVTAKNTAGESKATITLNVTPALAPPVITVKAGPYSTPQGTGCQVQYELNEQTGGKADSVKVSAINRSGAAVTGFEINTGSKTVFSPTNLSAGSYSVTVTATNSAGSGSASFTLEVTVVLTPPVVSIKAGTYKTPQDASLKVFYELSGGKADSVAVSAKNRAGAPVPGFEITNETGNMAVYSPTGLSASLYTVTVTATNKAGSGSASFTLEVTSSLTPPVVSIKSASYNTPQGTSLQVYYELSGGKADAVAVSATNRGGAAVPGFEINTGNMAVYSPAGLSSGAYSVTVTATNNAGSGSASFVLTVDPPSLIAPKITSRTSSGTVTQGTEYTTQFTATGSEKLIWSLLPAPAAGTGVPAEAVIDNSSGALYVRSSISVGTHVFIVKVENDAGSDSLMFTLIVQSSRIIEINPIKPGDLVEITPKLEVSPIVVDPKVIDPKLNLDIKKDQIIP